MSDVREPTWNDGPLPEQAAVNDWTPGVTDAYDALAGKGSRGAGADEAHTGLHQWANAFLSGSGNDVRRNRAGDAVGADTRVSGRDSDGNLLYNARAQHSNSGMNMLQSATAPITAGLNTVGNVLKIEGWNDWDGIANAVTGLAGDIGAVMDMAKQYEAFVECVTDPKFDPVQWLAGTLIDFLIQLFQPLEDLVGLVSGNESRMRKSAEMWVRVADGCRQAGDYITETGEAALADWVGADGDAARMSVGEMGQTVSVMGFAAVGMNALLTEMAELAKMLRQDIVDLIAKGVSWMLSTLLPQVAASVATFGATIATAVATGVARIASMVMSALRSIAQVLRISAAAGKVVSTVAAILQRIRPFLDFIKDHRTEIVNGTRLAQQALQ
ncbi:WXG100-like domain-containing protein [Glycomyces terrestris]|uniref:Outer membrane channel protein CpnT-like N-terminal domain-containing protein n=1 Tax=Glycomyces terrestris TaxID=2493553 RepID=A0A426UY09_9ACTN|nr:hypothetical protein [Glycomyces terrestris]RRR99455.1 hypothetical protein EIW28_12160 [Glycomyces terrestris]